MKQPTKIIVEELTAYDLADATMIGRLLAELSDRFDGSPVEQSLLEAIANSPHHTQLVARMPNGQVVGIATLSIHFGSGSGISAWLADFVVDPAARGQGVGNLLWQMSLDWSQARGAHNLSFTSKSSRVAAHKFYLAHGAVIRDTCYFKKSLE